jgi:MscS family membrane protein
MKRLFFLLSISMVLQVLGDEAAHPLLPADTSSPRDTLNSFTKNCEIAYALLQASRRDLTDPETRQEVSQAVRNIKRCVDLSHIAEFRRDNAGKEASVALKEVLDRIELPKKRDIPDREAMTNADGTLKERWTVPNTEITLVLIKEGPLEGTYQFSADTVNRAGEFLMRTRHLPYKKGATENFAATYLTTPGTPWLAQVVERLPKAFHVRRNKQAVWQWIGLVAVLLACFLLMATLYYIGRRVSKGGAEGGLVKYVLGLIFPILAVLAPLRAIEIITNELVIFGSTLYIARFNLSLLALFASMVVVLGIGRRVGEVIVSAPHIKSQSIDAQLIRIMSRLLGFVFAMVLLLQGGQHLGIPLSSLLAGAGVAGAALALSAQDLLKNIFGSIMLVMDKPFSVGERIKIKNYDGVVEEVGLRSTRIRLLNGHQAVIPNEDMARSDIENIGRRPFIRRVTDIPLPINVESAKAKKAVDIVSEVLMDHEGLNPDFPPRVWLNDFERDNLSLRMIYWYHPPSYWDYTAHADQVNRRILDAFEAEGITIALPAFSTRIDASSDTAIIPPQD